MIGGVQVCGVQGGLVAIRLADKPTRRTRIYDEKARICPAAIYGALSAATQCSQSVQPISAATRYCHSVLPLGTATRYCHSVLPLGTATRYCHSVQTL